MPIVLKGFVILKFCTKRFGGKLLQEVIMAEMYNHRRSSKLVFLLCCTGLLGVAFISTLFQASSRSPAMKFYISSSSLVEKHDVSPRYVNSTKMNKKKRPPNLLLPATYADLPAPETKWEQMASAPVPRLDGYSVQIKNLLYVFVGYQTRDYVHSHVDVYNFSDNTWCDKFPVPTAMANSHLGIASDGRCIYIVSGQHGPECRKAVANTFSLDTETRKWKSLPSLPKPRYAPATQLWRGRLHVMGGSKEDRHSPATDHWSIGVRGGDALDQTWRSEVPIPRGGPHRACVAIGERLYVIGGQEGDFQPKPGSPTFQCSRRLEVVYDDVYMLDGEMKWSKVALFPKPISHIECAWIVVNNSMVFVGGTTEKHPDTRRMTLVGELFRLHLDTLTWSVIGKLPFRVKTTLVGYWDGWLYFTSGQRDKGPDNPQPKKVIADMWRTKLHF